MEHHKLGRAPDYTAACIVMFGANLAWIMLLFLALYGLIVAVFVGLVVNHWLNWLEHRRRLAEEQVMQTPYQGN